jgi:hypothetical protein
MHRLLWLLVALALAWPAPGHAKLELKLDLSGYFRVRAVRSGNVFDTTVLPNTAVAATPQKSTDYLYQRVRLTPRISLGDVATLHVQIDALNNVVWGDNDLVSSTAPVFATGTSNTNLLGERVASVEVPRAWLELKIPVGLLRVGRMPSQWGLGLLANDGNGFRNEFDDAHFGSTADRVLFATRPVQVYKAIRGDRGYKSNLIFAIAYDKIVEEPCEVLHGSISNCSLLPPDDLWERYQEDRPAGSQAFLARNQNDVDELVLVLSYANPKLHLVRPDDQLTLGTYIVLRSQNQSFTKVPQEDDPKDTGTFVGIYDVYLKARIWRAYAEGEFVAIIGDTTGGVPLPPNSKKQIRLYGGVGRVGYVSPFFDFIVESGYASGTSDLEGEKFTQRPLHPDYAVGLVLYRQVLRERSYQVYSAFNARGFSSAGGVIDSAYVFPRVRLRPPWPKLKGLELVAGVLSAWADKRDEILFSAHKGDSGEKRGTYLGTEIDAALKYSFYQDHLRFVLEGGYLVFGEQLRAVDPRTGYPFPGDYWSKGAWTFQSRLAYVF